MTEEIDVHKQVALSEHKGLRHEIDVADHGRGRQLAPANASQAMTFAQMMARSGAAVPTIFRNNPGICLGVTMDAMMFGFNPFALARAAYEVGGAIGYEAKAYNAALNSSGFLRKRLQFSYSGEIKGTHEIQTKSGKRQAPAGTLKCKIIGLLVNDDDPKEWETPELGDITTKNSPLWYSDPKLQLYYYGVRSWARVHLPEVMLGVQTVDELQDAGGIDLREEKPKQTLIDRVKARRAEIDDQNADTPIAPEEPSKPEDGAKVQDVEVEEVVDDPSPEPVKPKRARAKKEKKPAAPPPEAAEPEPEPEEVVTTAPEPETVQQEEQPAAAAEQDAEEAETIDDALDRLKTIVTAAETLDALEAARVAWVESITDFSKEEQYDLQQECELIVGRRRVDIRRAMRAEKK